MKVKGNHVFITGGGSGIGLALAEALLRRDNRVVICGRDEAKLDAARARLQGLAAFRCDVSDEDDLRDAAARIERDFPSVNVLVNNAGVYGRHDFTAGNLDCAAIDNEVATDFVGPVKLCGLLLPHLRRQQEAAIVNVSSGLAFFPLPRAPVYSAAKAALHSFTLALRSQLRGTNVRVFEALPPLVDTDMASGQQKLRKMTANRCAEILLDGLGRDRLEMRIGLTALLYFALRAAPGVARRLLERG